MFFSVARLRLFIASACLLPSFVQARENVLCEYLLYALPCGFRLTCPAVTSSVSYCSPPESLLIQQFDITYFQHNTSVSFNISAASVVCIYYLIRKNVFDPVPQLPNVQVNANLFVNVYGMRPFNISLDLCKLLNGALCPLPTYNFTGADSLTLPSSVPVAHYIPGIAYKIPDLEAFAQLTLTEVGTGKVRACIQSTLSNGWSARQTSVEWATGGIAFLALASAVCYSLLWPDSLAPVRFMDLIYLFQSIAISALLVLNYPSVYRAYASNFSWALGLFSQSSKSSIQNSINNMRRLTGGHVSQSDAGSGAISLVNRQLSPYNNYLIPQSMLSRFAALPQVDISDFIAGNVTASPMASAKVLVGGQVETVTQDSSNILQAGIPIYVNILGISTANAFMTIFFVALILAAIVMFLLGLGWFLVRMASKSTWLKRRADLLEDARASYPAFARAWALRTSLVCVIPVLTFTFYQWTLKDSWLSILLSVLLLIAVLAFVVPPVLFIIRPSLSRLIRRDIDPAHSHSLVPYTVPLRRERLYFVLPVFLAILVKTLVIGFGQAHGMVQAIVILVVEFFLFGLIIVLKPFRSRGADKFAGTLAAARVICTGLLIAFSESLGLDAIPRVVIGIIAAVVWSLTVILMFFNILGNMGLWRLLRHIIPWRRRSVPSDATTLSSNNLSGASLEEGKQTASEKTLTITPTPSYYRRPENPAPTHTPTTVSAFSPNTTISHLSEPLSEYSRATTTSSTLGDPLPHRWSFHHSRPPSTSLHSHSHSAGLSPVTPTSESMYTTPRQSWRASSTDNHQATAI